MKRSILIFAAGMLAAGAASAGTFGAGNIGSPYIMWNGVLLVPTDGARLNAPGCATESARFAIDGSTAAGKVRAAVLPCCRAADGFGRGKEGSRLGNRNLHSLG